MIDSFNLITAGISGRLTSSHSPLRLWESGLAHYSDIPTASCSSVSGEASTKVMHVTRTVPADFRYPHAPSLKSSYHESARANGSWQDLNLKYDILIGASLSEPHIDEFAVEFLYIYYLYIYISYIVP